MVQRLLDHLRVAVKVVVVVVVALGRDVEEDVESITSQRRF